MVQLSFVLCSVAMVTAGAKRGHRGSTGIWGAYIFLCPVKELETHLFFPCVKTEECKLL